MASRTWCSTCKRYVGGGIAHNEDKHDDSEELQPNKRYKESEEWDA